MTEVCNQEWLQRLKILVLETVFDMKLIVKIILVRHRRIVVESDHFEIEWINSKTLRMTKANKEYHRITTTTSNTTLWGREHMYSLLLDCLDWIFDKIMSWSRMRIRWISFYSIIKIRHQANITHSWQYIWLCITINRLAKLRGSRQI